MSATAVDTPDELRECRDRSLRLAVEPAPDRFEDADSSELLGLADRCAAAGRTGDGIAKDLREGVGAAVLRTLRDDWPRFQDERRLLAGTLHRLSFALQDLGSPLTHGVADLARIAEGMDEHPHALFALRSSGLGWSKENLYTSAWLTFAELRQRLSHYERSYRAHGTSDHILRQFREVQQQALLAETGTASRTVEHTLLSWVPEPTSASDRWRILRYHDAFSVLRRGVLTGSLAADEVATLPTTGHKTVSKAAIDSWQRRPAVMTARCHLELIPLTRLVQRIGLRPPPPPDDWESFVQKQVDGFLEQYRYAHESPNVTFDNAHVRELAQLRLHAAVILPDLRVSQVVDRPDDDVDVPDCLRDPSPTIDDLADWLRAHGHNANIAASVTAPEYLATMQELSGRSDLIEWMFDEAQDPLRREAGQINASGPRLLPPEARPRYDLARELALQRAEEFRSGAAAIVR